MKEVPAQLPLLELFTMLREAGIPLAIDDYIALLQALQAGFGLPDRQSLARLCRLLWVKSPEDEALFKYHFAHMFHTTHSAETDEATMSSQGEHQADNLSTQPTASNASDQPPLLPIQLPNQVQSTWRAGLVPDYLPISQRQMKQSWRHLNRPIRQGMPVELDINATIRQAAVNGTLGEIFLVPPRSNRTSLLLLVDHGGSMAPFEPFNRRLIETALRGGRLGTIGVYYFHNTPIDYLYRDYFRQEAVPLPLVMAQADGRQAGLLIFSDAGAARGATNGLRIAQTRDFLAQARQVIKYIAWLNPMPRHRWAGSSADAIATIVPMFPGNRRGLDRAIDILRGRFDSRED